MDLVGKILANRYQIVETLGGGGMAIVYKARCTFLNRDVTVKMLRPEYTSDEEFVRRFRREAQSVASLSHTNIVNVYDVGQEGNTHFIVMEYVEGCNLKEIIRKQGSLGMRDAVEIAKQICDGLDHAHENGIIHRDIKPHNILITRTGRVKVTDFGIARATTSSTVTHTDTIVGSVHYFSPEQAKGEVTGVRSDIYSVGVVLYEMLTGKVPFEGESPIAIALKQIQEGPVKPRDIQPDIPVNLEKVILRAMAKNPEYRYATAREMRHDLAHVFIGEISESTKKLDPDEFATQVLPAAGLGKIPTVSRNPGEPMGPKEPPRKRKLNPLAILLIVATILGLGIGGFFSFNKFMRGEEVTVPKVIGETEEIAKAQLEAKGLRMKVRSTRFSDQEEGIVLSQSEDPGNVVKKNREILVDISKGTETVKVPSVVGQERDEAKTNLANRELNLGEVKYEFSEDPEGTVIRQEPAEDQDVSKGTAVAIWLSKGPEPQKIPVPNLVGLTVDEARRALIAAKLVLDEGTTLEESYEYEDGVVIKQTPAASSTELEEGSLVKVVVSKGPGPKAKTAAFQVTVPFDNATHRLEAVVFDVNNPQGKRDYDNVHNPGDVVSISVEYVGKGYVQFYLDGKPFGEKRELK